MCTTTAIIMTYTLTYENMDYIFTAGITEKDIIRKIWRKIPGVWQRQRSAGRNGNVKVSKKKWKQHYRSRKRTKYSITTWIGNRSGKDLGYVGGLNVVKGYIDRMEEVSSTKGKNSKKWEIVVVTVAKTLRW